MLTDMVRSTDEFWARWNTSQNFLFDPAYFQLAMAWPTAEEMVDVLRQDEKTRIQFPGKDKLEEEEMVEAFKSRPICEVMGWPFNMANFHLQKFYSPDGFLADFQDRVMIPWRTFLASQGFTWQRTYPILFLSGKGCSSTYHVDVSHVLAWQIYGEKTFNSFKDPERFAPIDWLLDEEGKTKAVLGDLPDYALEDIHSFQMGPGALLWNQLLTPHWVAAGDEVAISVNISHGGVSYQGAFCPNEVRLRQRWKKHPEEAWLVDERY